MAKKIFWDKGHGGSDPGAVANGLQEKVLTHKIVEYAMSYLSANYTGFEQRTSRTGDQSVELNSRDDLADNWGADVFVSVHINAGRGNGFETYIYSGNVSAATQSLQNMLHAEILATMHEFGPTPDRGKRRADFVVLRETDMPAVLTENLFIDSSDHERLKNETFLRAVGEAHARGVAKFLGLQSIVSGPPQPTDSNRWRIQTGLFDNAETFARAIGRLKEKYSWLIHEQATSTDLNPRYRIVTGLFTGRNVAEYYADQLKKEFGWNVYIIEG